MLLLCMAGSLALTRHDCLILHDMTLACEGRACFAAWHAPERAHASCSPTMDDMSLVFIPAPVRHSMGADHVAPLTALS